MNYPHTNNGVELSRQPVTDRPLHEDEEKKGNLFGDEQYLQVPPTLACAIGLNEAIVFQYLHWQTMNPKSGKVIDGHKWVWNTYSEWQKDHFPWWSIDTIKRIFQSLEARGFVESIQPEGGKSRIKYYRTNKAALKNLTYERYQQGNLPSSSSGQNASIHDEGKMPPSYSTVITQKLHSNGKSRKPSAYFQTTKKDGKPKKNQKNNHVAAIHLEKKIEVSIDEIMDKICSKILPELDERDEYPIDEESDY